MKFRMTDGKSTLDTFIDPELDLKDYQAIQDSKRPVSKAFDVAKKRHGITSGWFPVPGQALFGLDNNNQTA